MTFLIYAFIAITFFAIGWLWANKNIQHIENLTDDLEKAATYIENIETADIDEINLILHSNRNTNASFNIEILQHIENNELEQAKEILVNLLEADYDDIKEGAVENINLKESDDLAKKIEQLAKKYDTFKEIIK